MQLTVLDVGFSNLVSEKKQSLKRGMAPRS